MKWLAGFLILGLAAAGAGCGSSTDSTRSPSSFSQPSDQKSSNKLPPVPPVQRDPG